MSPVDQRGQRDGSCAGLPASVSLTTTPKTRPSVSGLSRAADNEQGTA